MNDLDARIREALRSEDAEILSEFTEGESIRREVVDLYVGRRRWINLAAMAGSVILFLAFLTCGYQFFQVDPLQPGAARSLIAWATAFLSFFIWLVLMKIWFWLELIRNSVTREVKRLELQVALVNQAQDAE